jgi:hypothetical protein
LRARTHPQVQTWTGSPPHRSRRPRPANSIHSSSWWAETSSTRPASKPQPSSWTQTDSPRLSSDHFDGGSCSVALLGRWVTEGARARKSGPKYSWLTVSPQRLTGGARRWRCRRGQGKRGLQRTCARCAVQRPGSIVRSRGSGSRWIPWTQRRLPVPSRVRCASSLNPILCTCDMKGLGSA